MKCFEVTINGKKVCTAGIEDDGVLTAILCFTRRKNSSERNAETQQLNYSESLDLSVGGLANRGREMKEHIEWFNQNLAVGDEIVIKIIEAPECDDPNIKEVSYLECSFCKKKQAEVVKLIAGPAVFVCNECVDDCTAALNTGEPSGSITMIIDNTAEARCSFCGKKPNEVEGIVGLSTARICDECITICREILAEDAQS